MKRSIDQMLNEWKEEPNRLPLIVRGARQVGKSYAIASLGERLFESTVEVNFEQKKECKACFDSLNPKNILQELELTLHQSITPGKTLLFLDEIQECPQAITALRYFKEQMPELHVIAAGSLLEFILNDHNFSFPVGRVQFLFMRPMSFVEFLEGINLSLLTNFLDKIELDNPPSETVHREYLKQVRLYMMVGGMPSVVQKYLETNSILSCRQLEDALLNAYEQDFGKYSTQAQHRYLQRLFQKCPEFVGSHVRYSKIDPESANPARDYKQAIRLLSNAGLIHPIHATAANGIPLRAEMSEKKFKLLFLDVGLLQSAMGMDPRNFQIDEISAINKGSLAEQFVGQELLAYSNPHRNEQLYFWERERTGSEAEVDFVLNVGPHIIPIEVKSGSSGKLKSIRKFMEEKHCPIGIKISEEPLNFENGILTIPFYLIHKLPKFAKKTIDNLST
jgi:predicted AAA+ superfamily ATPase